MIWVAASSSLIGWDTQVAFYWEEDVPTVTLSKIQTQSQKNFARDTAAIVSMHVQNAIAIVVAVMTCAEFLLEWGA